MSEAFTHAALMLALSIAALWLAPVVHRLAGRADRAFALFDAFVIVTVLGLALLEIIPVGVGLAGWPAILAVVAGALLPKLAERRFDDGSTHRAAAWLAFVGMAFHAVTDGLALVGSHVVVDSHALEWAVILHRVPVGLAVWWMLVAENGRGAAILALVMITVATILGFALGGVALPVARAELVGALEAFVGGLLLHVAGHRFGDRRAGEGGSRALSMLGGLVGLGFVVALFVVPELDEAESPLMTLAAVALLVVFAVAILGRRPTAEARAQSSSS